MSRPSSASTTWKNNTQNNDNSALWVQKYMYGGEQTLLGSAPADEYGNFNNDYSNNYNQSYVESNFNSPYTASNYAVPYTAPVQQQDLSKSLGSYSRRPSVLDQDSRHDLSASEQPNNRFTNAPSMHPSHQKPPTSRAVTRPMAANTYDLTGGGYTNEFADTGLYVSRTSNPVLQDHPLRAAIRNDSINKLNGNGKALAQPNRLGFKFNPRGAAEGGEKKKSNPLSSPVGFGSPLDRSRTADSSPHRFMLNTDSWKQKATGNKEIVNPAALQRNSGGWKFA